MSEITSVDILGFLVITFGMPMFGMLIFMVGVGVSIILFIAKRFDRLTNVKHPKKFTTLGFCLMAFPTFILFGLPIMDRVIRPSEYKFLDAFGMKPIAPIKLVFSESSIHQAERRWRDSRLAFSPSQPNLEAIVERFDVVEPNNRRNNASIGEFLLRFDGVLCSDPEEWSLERDVGGSNAFSTPDVRNLRLVHCRENDTVYVSGSAVVPKALIYFE